MGAGEIRPEFAPNTLLDVGAGPGTASFAAAQAFASLNAFALLDANDALRTGQYSKTLTFTLATTTP